MKKILFIIIMMIIGYNGFSQNVCPPTIPEITFFYSKPLVINQLIDTLFVCDPDEGQTHIWSIDDPSTFWSITETNVLYPEQTYIRVKDILVNDDTQSSYTFTVTVTDQGNFVGEPLFETVIIHLVENNEIPIIVENQVFIVDENLPATTFVGTVIASDENSNQTLTYLILSGNDNGMFDIDSNNGNITTTGELNHEGISSYSLFIQVVDSGTVPLLASETITITVIDVNEPPVIYR